jgi:tripartite-type tricarboxylate transporter receptor subunit TctC
MMTVNRGLIVSACAALAAGMHGVCCAQSTRTDAAADFPARPVRLVVPSAPGGGTDLIARTLAPRVSQAWRQSVVVENVSGGATTIGTNAVARAAPDGHTLLLTSVNFAFVPAIYPKLAYDPRVDLAPVAMVATQSSMLSVHPSVPVKSVAELIALAKKRPGEIRYGSGGSGSVGHLSSELFRSMAGIKLLHVPYKGNGPAVTALLSGELHMTITNIAAVLPHVKAGRLRGLAVTGTARSRVVPELPTVSESGVPGYEYSGWYGLWVTAKTPAAVAHKINEEFNRALADAVLRERWLEVGIEPQGGGAEKFAAYLTAEFTKWAKVARESNIAAE